MNRVTCTGYDTFLSKEFDVNTYATSVIKAPDNSSDDADIDVELAKLAVNIDIVNKQIQQQVVDNYQALLHQTTGIKELETVLNSIETNISKMNDSLALLSSRHREPYEQLLQYTRQLENLHFTCELLRKIHRFLLLVSRLKLQLSTNERDLSILAMTLYELQVIMEEADLKDIDIVTAELSFISQNRRHIEGEAILLLRDGIETQNSAKMASGLQVFYNMKQMGDRVYHMVQKMLDTLLEEIDKAVDLKDIQTELRNNSNTAEQTTSSTTLSIRELNNNLNVGSSQKDTVPVVWTRMENLMLNMSEQCIKIYSLEKVLKLKKDPLTHMSFLEQITRIFDATSLVSYFWRALSITLEKKFSQSPSFIQHLLASDYPRLLKLLHNCFSRVGMYTDTRLTDFTQSPEYLVMVQSMCSFS